MKETGKSSVVLLMEIQVTISKERHDELCSHSAMLGQICAVVAPYARGQNTTTLECVLKMDAKLRDIKRRKREGKL